MSGIKVFLLLLLGVCVLWDVATTMHGTFALIESKSVASILASAAAGIFILAMLGLTTWIFDQQIDVITFSFRIIWLLSLGYDFYTSWNGNSVLLFGGFSVEGGQFFILVFLTMFMSFSPIAWIYVHKNYY